MDEMEGVRQKQLQAMKKQLEEQQQAEEEAAKAENQLDSVLRVLLEPDAKQRLGNVHAANKALFLKTAQTILALYKAGHLHGKMNNDQLKKLLEKLSQKRETQIRRK